MCVKPFCVNYPLKINPLDCIAFFLANGLLGNIYQNKLKQNHSRAQRQKLCITDAK